MSERRCGGCHYFEWAGDERGAPERGVCRRWPPQTIAEKRGYASVQPMVQRDIDWCGEWRPPGENQR